MDLNIKNDWDRIAKLFAEAKDEDRMRADDGLNFEDRRLFNAINNIRLDCDYDQAYRLKSDVLEKTFQKIFDENKNLSTIRNRNIFITLFSIAASIALLLSIFTFYLFQTNKKTKEIYQVVFSSPNAVSSIILPDSTVVTLNTGSSLSYTTDYNHSVRKVYLTGEACFDVRPDIMKMFIVSTDKVDIKVFGTVFNVDAYPEDKEVVTSLISGFIQLENKENEIICQLKPNQSAIYDKETSKLVMANFSEPEYATGWMSGNILFKRKTMHEISKLLEKKFNCTIEIKNKELQDKIFTGKFVNDESLPEIFKTIQINIPFKYSISINQITIY